MFQQSILLGDMRLWLRRAIEAHNMGSHQNASHYIDECRRLQPLIRRCFDAQKLDVALHDLSQIHASEPSWRATAKTCLRLLDNIKTVQPKQDEQGAFS